MPLSRAVDGGDKGDGEGGVTTGAKWLALFDGVMQRDISAGSQQAALWGSDSRTKRRWGNTDKSTSSGNLNLQANTQRTRLEALGGGESQTGSLSVLIKLSVLAGVMETKSHIKVLFHRLHI